MPPARAIAIAIRDSVTVSIAELTNGTFSRMRAGELAGRVGCGGHHIGGGGKQQHVVEREPEHRDLGGIIAAGRHRYGDGEVAFSDRHG